MQAVVLVQLVVQVLLVVVLEIVAEAETATTKPTLVGVEQVAVAVQEYAL